MSGGVSVLCWHDTSVAGALWKPIFGEMSDTVIMLSPVMSQTGIMSDRYRVPLVSTKSQKGQDQVSGGVSVLCWHVAPVANVLWRPHTIR